MRLGVSSDAGGERRSGERGAACRGCAMIGAAGWFAFPRALFESPVWTTAPCATWRVWTWCAASAGYQPTVWHDGTTAVEIPAGAFVVSRQRLAAACRVTDKQARRAIAFLEAGGLIRTTVSPNRWTMITVLDSTVYGQQGPAEGPKETKGQQKGQPPDPPNPPVIPSNERTCADGPETKGQPKGQPKGHNKTIQQENNPGGGENPSFVDAAARAAVPPPLPPIPIPTAPAGAGEIEQLVRDLAKVHPGETRVSFAVKDAAAAFARSGESDASRWCDRMRQAHGAWIAARPWGRRVKGLGYWFADGDGERFTGGLGDAAGPGDAADQLEAEESRLRALEAQSEPVVRVETPPPARPAIRCLRCGDSGLFCGDEPLLVPTAEQIADPAFDLEALWNVRVPCPDCQPGGGAAVPTAGPLPVPTGVMWRQKRPLRSAIKPTKQLGFNHLARIAAKSLHIACSAK
jgi:hypothetical protein